MSDESSTSTAKVTIKVRMLVDHKLGDKLLKCNTRQTLDAKTAVQLVRSGVADDNEDAVAAAEDPAE